MKTIFGKQRQFCVALRRILGFQAGDAAFEDFCSRVWWSNFDGKVFSNVSKPVGVPGGTKVVILEAQKFGRVDDSAKTDEQNIQKLLDGQIDLLAGYSFDLKVLIDSKYKDKVEILPVPLLETFYYLAFSKKFTATNKDFAEKVWDEIGALK